MAAVRALPDAGGSLPYGFGNYIDLSEPDRRTSLINELQERLKYAPVEDRMGAIALLEAQAVSPLILPRAIRHILRTDPAQSGLRNWRAHGPPPDPERMYARPGTRGNR